MVRVQSGNHVRCQTFIQILSIAKGRHKMMRAHGLDDAVIGVGQRCGDEDILVYDAQKIVDILVNREKMSREEAWEYFEFNICGAYVGPTTPIYMLPMSMEEIEENFFD